MEAVVSLSLPDNWITDVVEQFPSVIKVIDSKTSSNGVRDLVQIEVENEDDLPKVIEQVRNNPNIFNVDISAIDRGKALAVFSTNQCMVCRLLAGTECFLTGSTTRNGRMSWTMLVTEKKALQDLIANLEKLQAGPKLVKLTEIAGTDELTQRQEQITRMAYERGYFDFPRKVALRDLAKAFGISTSTLSEILRKGQRRIMTRYFSEHRQY
ncbi:helix-turn-helix domain-containing protein [Methanomassiliicoccus luminyensis]|uniref:helix-turn-helix domain-containing protein n=1 Tax=Methanomassiliicoccus luminyensis TaxID=1080712 RepID=UPI001F25D77D|nr:helix-turn-helix domain-containing protein [Methanomassiliicoccus luminyensis]